MIPALNHTCKKALKLSHRRPLTVALVASALVLTPLPGLVTPAAAQFTVFDPTNYGQNLLTAARSLEQVNNQVRSLQNELTMLQNMARDLKSLDYSALAPIKDALQQIDTLMAQAKGMAFTVASTEAVLRDAYPVGLDANATTSTLLQNAKAQAQAAMDRYRQTLKVQARVVENIQADAGLIDALIARSQGAAGGLEAQQAANQLQALAIKQDQQIQVLMAAQYRAQALESARQAQVLEASKLAARAAARAASQPFRDMASRAAGSFAESAQRGRAGAWRATGGTSPVAGAAASAPAAGAAGQGGAAPAWARRLQSAQSDHVRRHAVLQAVKDGDRPGGSANPDLSSKED